MRSRDINRELAALTERDNLLKEFAQSEVELRSSNSYSKGIHHMMLSNYIYSLPTMDQNPGLANETFYLFGGNTGELWDIIEERYVLPGCQFCDIAGAVIPGLGGYNSGVSFHFHGPGFSEVIHGAKRWFLYPPAAAGYLAPDFHPDMTVSQWVSDVYDKLDKKSDLRPQECVIHPGEVLFFPDRWVHATLNVEEYVFFVSVFLDYAYANNLNANNNEE